MKRKALILIILAAALVAGLLYLLAGRSRDIVVTGMLTTAKVIVGPEIQARFQQLLVKEGDVVTNGQLLAVIHPQEWKADEAFYASGVQQSTAQTTQAESDLRDRKSTR